MDMEQYIPEAIQMSKGLGILHGLEEFHHYCFNCDIRVSTDHKPLVAIFEKGHTQPN